MSQVKRFENFVKYYYRLVRKKYMATYITKLSEIFFKSLHREEHGGKEPYLFQRV